MPRELPLFPEDTRWRERKEPNTMSMKPDNGELVGEIFKNCHTETIPVHILLAYAEDQNYHYLHTLLEMNVKEMYVDGYIGVQHSYLNIKTIADIMTYGLPKAQHEDMLDLLKSFVKYWNRIGDYRSITHALRFSVAEDAVTRREERLAMLTRCEKVYEHDPSNLMRMNVNCHGWEMVCLLAKLSLYIKPLERDIDISANDIFQGLLNFGTLDGVDIHLCKRLHEQRQLQSACARLIGDMTEKYAAADYWEF